jgi:hypothetical protein
LAIIVPLVVVGDLHVVGISAVPSETDTPLVVDRDAVLPGPITSQLLQPIPGLHAKVIQPGSGVHHPKLSQSDLLHFSSEPASWSSVEQPLGVPVAEALDHVA